MGLFTKKNNNSCSCGRNCISSDDLYEKGDILVLGSSCSKCIELERNVNNALKELNMDNSVKHITDITEIARFGVMSTPSLVVDGKVVSSGKVLSSKEIKSFLVNEK